MLRIFNYITLAAFLTSTLVAGYLGWKYYQATTQLAANSNYSYLHLHPANQYLQRSLLVKRYQGQIVEVVEQSDGWKITLVQYVGDDYVYSDVLVPKQLDTAGVYVDFSNISQPRKITNPYDYLIKHSIVFIDVTYDLRSQQQVLSRLELRPNG
jgi:hypothetical protein